jgi:hypothetical protein
MPHPHVIEVKGFSAESFMLDDQIDAKQGKFLNTIQNASLQVQEYARALIHSKQSAVMSFMTPFYPVVGLPFMRREFLAKLSEKDLKSLPVWTLFEDDLNPQSLRNTLREISQNQPIRKARTRSHVQVQSESNDRYRVFISYRREDSKWAAGRIADALKNSFGSSLIFLDTSDIRGGQRWRSRIKEVINGSSVVLIVMGTRWLLAADEISGKRRIDDPKYFLRIEVDLALNSGSQVIPLLVDNAAPPRKEHLPRPLERLEELQVERISYDRFDTEIEQTIRTVRDLLNMHKH